MGRSARAWWVSLLLPLATACGGGSSSSSGTNGTGGTGGSGSSGGFTLAATSASFTALQAGALPASVSLALAGDRGRGRLRRRRQLGERQRLQLPGREHDHAPAGAGAPGIAYPDAVLCRWNGLVIGGTDSYYDATDVWVYDGPSGAQLAKLSSSSKTSYRALLSRGLTASGDATRLVTLVGLGGYMTPGEVRFQTLPAAP